MDTKIKGYPSLKRKGNSGGVVNTNYNDYQAALMRIKKNKEFSELKEKVDTLSAKLDLILKRLE